jgi:hypothetical protein
MAALAQRSDVLDDQRPGQGFRTVSEMIRSNSLSRTIGDTTMRFAIWVAYLEGTPNEWNSVVIPRGSVFPRFGQAPDDDYGFDSDHGDGGAFCWTEGAEQPPTLPTRNDVATARGTDQGRTSTGTPTARNANGASTPGEIAARNAQQPATISARWAALTNTEKGAVVVGGVLVAFAGYKLLAGKRGRRRRRG